MICPTRVCKHNNYVMKFVARCVIGLLLLQFTHRLLLLVRAREIHRRYLRGICSASPRNLTVGCWCRLRGLTTYVCIFFIAVLWGLEDCPLLMRSSGKERFSIQFPRYARCRSALAFAHAHYNIFRGSNFRGTRPIREKREIFPLYGISSFHTGRCFLQQSMVFTIWVVSKLTTDYLRVHNIISIRITNNYCAPFTRQEHLHSTFPQFSILNQTNITFFCLIT